MAWRTPCVRTLNRSGIPFSNVIFGDEPRATGVRARPEILYSRSRSLVLAFTNSLTACLSFQIPKLMVQRFFLILNILN